MSISISKIQISMFILTNDPSINLNDTGNNVVHLEQRGLQHLARLARALHQEGRLSRLRCRAVPLLTFAHHHLTLQEVDISFLNIFSQTFFRRALRTNNFFRKIRKHRNDTNRNETKTSTALIHTIFQTA